MYRQKEIQIYRAKTIKSNLSSYCYLDISIEEKQDVNIQW